MRYRSSFPRVPRWLVHSFMLLGMVSTGSYALPPVCTPPPAGLVGWWPGDGHALDIWSGNNGALQGTAAFVTGQVGPAFDSDGTQGAGVALGNPAGLQLQDFTIAAWVRRKVAAPGAAGNGPSNEGGILVYGNGGYSLGILPNGVLFLSNVDNTAVISTGLVADTSFHHVAVTKAGTAVVFYIDGTAAGSPTYNTTFTFTKNVSIGSRLDTTPPASTGLNATLNGSVDELGVFNRALDAAEVLAIFSAGSAGMCKPTNGCTLDVDGNGSVDALTDGLLLMRAMFGLSGNSVTNNAVGGGATRSNWQQIQPFLNYNCKTNFSP